MAEWPPDTLHPDMVVCDDAGELVGVVARVHAAAAASRPPLVLRAVVEVSNGLLGLGPPYYIPTAAIAEVSGDVVFLSVPGDALAGLGWQARPADLGARH